MRFPERSDTHVTEDESWRLFQSLAPKQWIVREATGRDYGIDAYIELVSDDGRVTGELMSAQLKGVQGLSWTAEEVRSPSVKTTTAGYWLNFPVPVFLFVADLTTKNIHYVAAKEEIRTQFYKLNDQGTISFKLTKSHDFASKTGLELLRRLYARERLYSQFSFHITNLITQVGSFSDFISANQNRDIFMEVDVARHLQFRTLYESCRMASLYLLNEWDVESLEELYKMDRNEWKDDYTYLHEKTLDYALQKLEKLFPDLIRSAVKLVCGLQSEYWRAKDPVFYNLCRSGELDWTLKQFESR